MASTGTITTRVSPAVKREATDALAAMGLTVSGAVAMFLTRVASEKAIPFDVRVPNAATLAAIAEGEKILARKAARFKDPAEMIASLEAGGR